MRRVYPAVSGRTRRAAAARAAHVPVEVSPGPGRRVLTGIWNRHPCMAFLPLPH